MVLACALAVAGDASPAGAVRRLFEPTDLEIETAGTAELDLQLGFIRGRPPWRLSIPDFELDLGVGRDLELDVDGALAWHGPDDGRLALDHLDGDNLWLALKAGLVSWDLPGDRPRAGDLPGAGPDASPPSGDGLALGIQLGPKAPTARGARGWGAEGLLLFAWHTPRVQLVLNVGSLWDPHDGGKPRPWGLEGGVDVSCVLDPAARFSFVGEAGGVAFRSADAAQSSLTFGLAYEVTEALQLSLVALAGLVPGSDRYGILVGMSPKLSFASAAKREH